MTNLLRRGRLEVETDLLLGAEEVLLPSGVAVTIDALPASPAAHAKQTAGVATATPPPVARSGFDAALFAPTKAAANSAAAPAEPRGVAATGDPRADPRADSSVSRAVQAPSRAPAPPRVPTVHVAEVAPMGLGAPVVHIGAPVVPIGSPVVPIGSPVVPIVDHVVAPGGASKSERLAALDALHARACPHCTAATAHTRLVFGEGNPDAELVFVGEAPGETEDQQGRPFVGRAGEKLDSMIGAMGFTRADVYIANVLKSRPPDNRTPLAHEIERCGPYLLAQLSVIRPKVIVTLGGPATKLLLASELGITRLRGVFGSVRLGVADGAPFDVPVMPTFHPAYLLRNYTTETRAQVWEDLKKVLTALGREAPSRKSS